MTRPPYSSRSQPGYRAARSLSVAVAGLFVGHLLVYRLIAPNALQRAVLLASTGHAYLPAALAGGAALGGMGAAAGFLLAFHRGRAAALGGPWGRRSPLLWLLVLPAAAQAGAFVVLEVAERLLSGVPLGGLFAILPVGILLQLAVGALGGLLLFGIDLAGEGAGRAWSRGPQPAAAPRTHSRPPVPACPAAAPRVEAFGIRGPPLAV